VGKMTNAKLDFITNVNTCYNPQLRDFQCPTYCVGQKIYNFVDMHLRRKIAHSYTILVSSFSCTDHSKGGRHINNDTDLRKLFAKMAGELKWLKLASVIVALDTILVV